ncbi:MAG: hypothetical protein JW395_2103 [Nitrospira sp.]|nr:hypothetical protein [Nitrospira sp.]
MQFTKASTDGTVEFEVKVLVSEMDGSNALWSDAVLFSAVSFEDRYEAAYYEDMQECLRRIMSRLGFNPLPPPGPRPPGAPSLSAPRVTTVATLIAEIEAANPRAAQELREFQDARAAEHLLLARLKSPPSTAT